MDHLRSALEEIARAPDQANPLWMKQRALDALRPRGESDDELTAAAQQVYHAVTDSGRAPQHHHKILKKHRTEWPTLWTALDRLCLTLACYRMNDRKQQ